MALGISNEQCTRGENTSQDKGRSWIVQFRIGRELSDAIAPLRLMEIDVGVQNGRRAFVVLLRMLVSDGRQIRSLVSRKNRWLRLIVQLTMVDVRCRWEDDIGVVQGLRCGSWWW